MPQASGTRKSPVIPLLVVAVALIAVVFTFVASRDDGDEESATTTTGNDSTQTETSPADDGWAQLVRRDDGDPMALGEVDAPVVMVSYSEFQCPFCGKYARDTEPTLVDKYVDTGMLRIEWRDFPYLGPESLTAAQAGRAAAAQDHFWEFNRAMYDDQAPPNSGTLTEDYLVSVAEDLGLDTGQFRRDMIAPDATEAIKRDFAEGQAIGVTGTPAFVINGMFIIGAQPTEVFEQAIEEAANQANAGVS